MENESFNAIEAVGEKFNLVDFLAARESCQAITAEIVASLQEGMREQDGQDLVKKIFAKHNIYKFWHPTKFRMAADTLKSFREPPDPDLRLRSGDLCFLDLGPIIQDHEADFGRTFIFTQNAKNSQGSLNSHGSSNSPAAHSIINAAEDIFRATAKAWKREGLSGQALFAFAEQAARSCGLELNPHMAGHRLGDFPHHIHSKQKLFDLTNCPSANLWVLEIHVLDRALGRGAFYEDILL